MANKKTGELIDVAPLDGEELVHVEQDGNSRKTTLDEIAEYCASTSIFEPIHATGTGSPQNITLPFVGLTVHDVSVFVNGIRYETSEYAISTNLLTISTNASGDSIEVLSLGKGNGTGVALTLRAPVKEVTTSSYNLLAPDDGKYLRFTYAGEKVINVRNHTTEALPSDGVWYIRNIGTGNITFTEDTSVTINIPYGGSMVMSPGMTVTLKKVGVNEFDLSGQTNP